MRPKFVDEYANIFYDDQATEMLKNKNDTEFLGHDGIKRISNDRWEEAQRYERMEWMDKGLDLCDDRNEFHFKKFNGYKILKGINLENVLEIGCGPFTNIRMIQNVCSIETAHLNDPLIDAYKTHPHNKYAEIKANKVFINTTAELIPSQQFDAIVMINVLEHCYNIPLIFSNILHLLNKGEYFIFSDVVWDYDVIQKMANTQYNAGHPIRLNINYVMSFLGSHFDILYQYMETEMYAGVDIKPIGDIYFIGRKK